MHFKDTQSFIFKNKLSGQDYLFVQKMEDPVN